MAVVHKVGVRRVVGRTGGVRRGVVRRRRGLTGRRFVNISPSRVIGTAFANSGGLASLRVSPRTISPSSISVLTSLILTTIGSNLRGISTTARRGFNGCTGNLGVWKNLTVRCPRPVTGLVSDCVGLPKVNRGATAHLTFCALKVSRGSIRSFTGSLLDIGGSLRCYDVYNFVARSSPYPVYQSGSHSHSAVLIIRRSRSVVTVRQVRRCRNLCRILRNSVSPDRKAKPVSVGVPTLLGHLRGGARIGRVVITAGTSLSNRAATRCLTGLVGPTNVEIAHLTRKLSTNTGVSCASRMALFETIRNEARV